MRILLLGEYSRLHNSLKEGLVELGYEVVIAGTGDGFKRFDVDLNYESVFNRKGLPKFVAKIALRIFGIDLVRLGRTNRFRKLLPKLRGFDIVQLINEQPLKIKAETEIALLRKVFDENDSIFLLACGTDYLSVKYAFDGKFRYSILSPYRENPELKNEYRYILNYLEPAHKKLHEFVFDNIQGVISSDLDYHIPLADHSLYLGMIPNPVNINQIKYRNAGQGEKITIFHGVNRSNFIKKGNRFFDQALENIARDHGESVQIIRTEDLTYQEYQKARADSDILLDQVYAYDQGYNALEAMAMGIVVFTGAEQEWLNHYNLQEDEVVINALPDTEYLVKKLKMLIDNPQKIRTISKAAREFIEREHDYRAVAKSYLYHWRGKL